jgi:hypothetical protein
LPERHVNIFGFGPQPRPTLVLEKGLLLLQPYVKPMLPSDTEGFIHYDQVGQSVALLISGFVGAGMSQFIAGKIDRSQPNSEQDDQ